MLKPASTLHIHIYTCICIRYKDLYIYIYKERYKERERKCVCVFCVFRVYPRQACVSSEKHVVYMVYLILNLKTL